MYGNSQKAEYYLKIQKKFFYLTVIFGLSSNCAPNLNAEFHQLVTKRSAWTSTRNLWSNAWTEITIYCYAEIARK